MKYKHISVSHMFLIVKYSENFIIMMIFVIEEKIESPSPLEESLNTRLCDFTTEC